MSAQPNNQLAPRASLNAGILALALLGASAGFAQSASTPSYLPENPQVIELETLEVNGNHDAYAVTHTITGTKTDTALVNVPQAITVITADLINDQSMKSIGDVTRYVPGVGIAQGEGNRDTPVLRGNSTTADFFVNGVRDDVQYMRDLYNVERVEVLKGPNAMIFGRGGSGGIINRITKIANGSTLRELSFQTGGWDEYRGTLDFAQPLSDSLSLRLTGLYEDSESFRDAVTIERYGLNPTAAWHIAPRTKLTAGYEYFKDERVADRGVPSFNGRPLPTDPSTFFGDPSQSPVSAEVHTLFAQFDHTFDNDLHLRNHTHFGHYDKFYQNVYPGAVNGDASQASISAYNNATDRENFFNQTDFTLPLETGPLKHQLLAGFEFGRQVTDNLRQTGYFNGTATIIDVPVANPRSTDPITFRQSPSDAANHGVADTLAFYLQDQVEILPKLQAIAGLRYEIFDIDFRNNLNGSTIAVQDNLVSPRAGLIYKPITPLSLYASYSMSYVPRAGEQLSSLTLTNSALDPEEFKNYEIGLKWDYRPDLAFTAAAYQLDRSNVSAQDPADPTKSILTDGQRSKGIELSATGRLTSNWSIVGGYAYQHGEFTATQSAAIPAGNRLAQLPRHTFSLWNRYDFSTSWGIGLGLIYRDSMFATADNAVTLPSFVRFDAALFYRLNNHFRAQLNIENLLDKEYYASAHNNNNITPGSPIVARLTLIATF